MIYIQLSNGALIAYSGMTQSDVTSLITAQGYTGTFLTAEQFKAAVAAIIPNR